MMTGEREVLVSVRNVILMLVFLLFTGQSFAQETEHNFEMGPQITDCDSLDLAGMKEMEKIREIEKTTFRFHQKFSLNRPDGFQGAWFYSCDNMSGYFIALIDDHKRLYKNISKGQWDAFVNSGDFAKYIKEHFE